MLDQQERGSRNRHHSYGRRWRSAVIRSIAALVVLFGITTTLGAMESRSAATTATTKPLKIRVEMPPNGIVTETGSAALFPLFNLWSAGFNAKYPKVAIETARTDSGTGISSALSGAVDIGASDISLSTAQLVTTPAALNIPLVISAQFVAYDLPGITTHLTLSGSVLSEIYQGKITNWRDPAVVALNSGVTLPNLPIVALHRFDDSIDTLLWTTYLSDTDPSGWGRSVGYNSAISWPMTPGALGETGSSNIVTACKATPGCIAYVDIAYLTQALQAGLMYAALLNARGKAELPTPAAISAEAAGFKRPLANGTQSLIYTDAVGGYPIVHYEYAMVNSNQSNSMNAKAIRSVLEWAVNPNAGNSASYLDQIHAVSLPPGVGRESYRQILKIH